MAESDWEPWVAAYLGGIPDGEMRADLAPAGPLANGKAAIALAKTLWTQAYGAPRVHALAPYRAFRHGSRWILLGQGPAGSLGQGLILVVEADSGQVVRIVNAAP